MRKLTAKDYGKILYSLHNEKDAAQLFLRFLQKRRVIRLLPRIFRAFEKYYREQEGIEGVEVTTAEPLSETDKKRLRKDLEEKLTKKIELEEAVDKSLIGGIKLKIGEDKLIDGSVKGLLRHF